MSYAAVVFDLGGVVFPSPFDAWAAYEGERSLPVGFIRTVVATSGEQGAWARHERGEVSFDEFCAAFEAECAASAPEGARVSGVEVMARLAGGWDARPAMVTAIERVRGAGLRTGALTNNWVGPVGDDGRVEHLAPLFDAVVESAVEGLRKPDPRMYLLVCERLDVEPHETVFLDDLGVNLKPARQLGMTTIKVTDPGDALAELASVLGFPLD